MNVLLDKVSILKALMIDRLGHKLYKRLHNKLDDDWLCLNNDIAELIYRGLWIKWEKIEVYIICVGSTLSKIMCILKK